MTDRGLWQKSFLQFPRGALATSHHAGPHEEAPRWVRRQERGDSIGQSFYCDFPGERMDETGQARGAGLGVDSWNPFQQGLGHR